MTTQTLTAAQPIDKIKLYTCEDGVWLNRNNSSFSAWKDENHETRTDGNVYSFYIDRSQVDEFIGRIWSHDIPAGIELEFTKVEVK